MPEKTTNLNLPIPLGNENVNRQYFVDLIQAIDSGAVSEQQLTDQVKRLTEGKQDVVRLADNYRAPTAAITEYPQGFSVFYVGGGTGGQGAAWATAAGATETFGWVETVRTGSAGYQTFTEMYSGTDTTATSGNRQFKRNKRDSNSFWQPFERILDQDDLVAHNADYVRQPGYGATAGTGAAYTVTLSPAPTALVDGLAITIVPHIANTVADPTLKIGVLGALPIRRQSGAQFAAGSIKAGQPLSLVKVGSYFLARSVGSTGTATAAQVRAGATFSNESNVDLVGTLAVQATVAQTVTPGTTDQVKAAGLYDGAITIKGDANLISENILYGKSIFSVSGSVVPAQAVTAGTTVIYNDSAMTYVNNSYFGGNELPLTLKSIRIEIGGTYRLQASLQNVSDNAAVKIAFYKNAVIQGNVQSHAYNGTVIVQQDIPATKPGDIITVKTGIAIRTNFEGGTYAGNIKVLITPQTSGFITPL